MGVTGEAVLGIPGFGDDISGGLPLELEGSLVCIGLL
jgi:hypothetical protein